MDWFSWLSRTALDPLHTYEYGLLFARNSLKPDDIPRFNHHFLQKIGISVAKHRLEILKLAKSHTHRPNLNNPLLSAFSKTKNCLRNCLRKLTSPNSKPEKTLFRGDPAVISPEPPTDDEEEEVKKVKEVLKPPRRRIKHVSLSGPLDGGRMHEKFVMNSKSLKLSGPLDRKERPVGPHMFPRSPRTSGPLDGRITDWALCKSPKVNGPPQGKMMRLIPPSRSPRVSGPLDGRDGSPRICCRCNRERMEADDDYHSLWVSLFYDMKPT